MVEPVDQGWRSCFRNAKDPASSHDRQHDASASSESRSRATCPAWRRHRPQRDGRRRRTRSQAASSQGSSAMTMAGGLGQLFEASSPSTECGHEAAGRDNGIARPRAPHERVLAIRPPPPHAGATTGLRSRASLLVLRRFIAQDADLLIELASGPRGECDTSPVVSRCCRPAVVRDRGRSRSVYSSYVRAVKRPVRAVRGLREGDRWFPRLVTMLRQDPTVPEDEVAFGYRLRQDACGKGYATEGRRRLCTGAFSELGINTVWGRDDGCERTARNG